ncbi:hypothetical protein [Nonomuraea sediminis]|uniref:hypothetical protein n=1 Tax=Nonomuraea sediminis TaxID=2835864 RepID=UPI001BDC3AEE|nr:hypothetical protein [Nonomuraea sediminis]
MRRHRGGRRYPARWAALFLLLGAAFGVGAPAAQARTAQGGYHWDLVLPGGGATFDSFDYNAQSRNINGVDWPVDLIFTGRATINRVKNVVSGTLSLQGGVMYAWVNGVWDSDKGLKQHRGSTCQGDSYHFRVYAPPSTDQMYSNYYGYFVIATSHNDYNENCYGGYSYHNETDERWIAGLFSSHGYAVHPDSIYLNNYENAGSLGYNDGWATEVVLP